MIIAHLLSDCVPGTAWWLRFGHIQLGNIIWGGSVFSSPRYDSVERWRYPLDEKHVSASSNFRTPQIWCCLCSLPLWWAVLREDKTCSPISDHIYFVNLNRAYLRTCYSVLWPLVDQGIVFFYVNSFQDMKTSLNKRRGPVRGSAHVGMYVMWSGFTVGFNPYWSCKFYSGVSAIFALPGNTVCQCFCKGCRTDGNSKESPRAIRPAV